MGEFGSRSLLAATGVNGLNTTSKVSVLDLAVPGSAACDAAEIDTTPARPSTRAAAALVRATFRTAPLPATAPTSQHAHQEAGADPNPARRWCTCSASTRRDPGRRRHPNTQDWVGVPHGYGISVCHELGRHGHLYVGPPKT